MQLSANVRACRFAWCLREPMGTSDRLLSSSQRWRSCWRPSKLSSGTVVIWFASRRLQDRSRRKKKVWLQRPFYTGQMSKSQLHSGCFHFDSDHLNGTECTKVTKMKPITVSSLIPFTKQEQLLRAHCYLNSNTQHCCRTGMSSCLQSSFVTFCWSRLSPSCQIYNLALLLNVPQYFLQWHYCIVHWKM